MSRLKRLWSSIVGSLLPTYRSKVAAILLAGTLAGVVGYLVYVSKAYSYLSDNPEVCINCHVMGPYYATWQHSSHFLHTTCNDCHVPHDNLLSKYYFKATDGLRHSYVFTVRGEPQRMQAIPESQTVIYENCVRCHAQLNQEFVHTGKLAPHEIKAGEEQACWDCHREVPHGGKNSLSATPHNLIPYLESPVPEWIKKHINKKTSL